MPKSVGAPAQHSQPSRKGKKAWRKHVDIEPIEQALEDIRDQERTIGEALHKKTDEQLFQIDITGDENLKQVLPKFDSSQLMSSKILAQRSAIPALHSRTSKLTSHIKITREEKAKLLRMGKRKVKGPFNTYVDPSELGAGSAVMEPSEAVKNSGKYDAWGAAPDPTKMLKGKGKFTEPEDYLLPLVQKPIPKPPKSLLPHRTVEVPAISQPHQGTSYNPLETAHRDLLLTAHEIEVRKEAEAAKFVGIKERMTAARRAVAEEVGAPGMIVDTGDAVTEDGESVVGQKEDVVQTNKPPPRKTAKQRRKAALLLEQRRVLMAQKQKKRFLAGITAAKSLRSQVNSSLKVRQARLEARRLAQKARLKKMGLVGRRLGRHRVPEGQVDVQLGEELAESFRELKPQGNLFRDRFQSMQQRALVEPRVPVLPKRRKAKIKEYEKHAWKRFDRDS